jgi:hypothetical protein
MRKGGEMRVSAGLVVLLLSTGVHAQAVYQCKDAKGKKTFSDIPCVGVSETTVVVKPAMGAGTGEMDPNIARQLRDLRARERDERQAEADLARTREANRAWDEYRSDSKTRRCSDLRRSLDVHRERVRTGPIGILYNESRAQIPALEAQIQRDC